MKIVCTLVGQGDFKFSEYAESNYPGISQDDLGTVLRPVFYAAAVSTLTTAVIIVGGSNLAKFVYYRTVMSRKEEAAAQRAGQDGSEMRDGALAQKVRQAREADIVRSHIVLGTLPVLWRSFGGRCKVSQLTNVHHCI